MSVFRVVLPVCQHFVNAALISETITSSQGSSRIDLAECQDASGQAILAYIDVTVLLCRTVQYAENAPAVLTFMRVICAM